MSKISGLIIGIILVGLFAGVFGVWLGQLADNYGLTDYNDTSLNEYNRLDEINNLTFKIKEGVENRTTKTGVTDILGDFFNSGYNTLLITFKSFDIFSSITATAIGDLPLGDTGQMFKIALIAIVLITIVAAIISIVIAKSSNEV